MCYKKLDSDIHVELYIIPNSKKNTIVGEYNGRLKIKIMSQPEKGKANEFIIKYLSKLLRTSKGNLEIIKGHTSQEKTLKISNLSLDEVKKSL